MKQKSKNMLLADFLRNLYGRNYRNVPIDLSEKERNVIEDKKRLQEKIRCIALDCLPEKEYSVFYACCVKNFSWERTEIYTGYCRSHCFRLLHSALEILMETEIKEIFENHRNSHP